MNKVDIMITYKGPVFSYNVAELFLCYASDTHCVQRHTAILVKFYLNTCIMHQSNPTVKKIKECIRRGDGVGSDVINTASGSLRVSL